MDQGSDQSAEEEMDTVCDGPFTASLTGFTITKETETHDWMCL